MSYLVAAVVFLGVLCVVNLLLTLAVIRRLREHAAQLQKVPLPPPFTPPGTKVPDFAATLTARTGAPAQTTVVGMFSTTCTACEEHLPGFVERIRPLGRERVMALIVGEGPKADAFTAELSPVATVVVEDRDGPLYTAFHWPPFPGFYVVDGEGVVTASAPTLDELPIPATA